MPHVILKEIDISPLLRAHAFLKMGIETAKSDLEKAGAIQGFEFCYELACKTMKRILSYRGTNLASPREVFRAAAVEKLIPDPEVWFDFIDKRNLTAHTYNHDIAQQLFKFLPHFEKNLARFIDEIKKL